MFAGIFLDCAGLPIAGELLLLTLGGLAAQGQLHPGLGAAVAAAGALAGDAVGYSIGRSGGKRLLLRLQIAGRWPIGPRTIVFGRFLLGARMMMAPMAGARRHPFHRFLIFDAVGAALWATAFVFLGYVAGARLGAVHRHWATISAVVLITLVGVAAVYVAWRLVRIFPRARTA